MGEDVKILDSNGNLVVEVGNRPWGKYEVLIDSDYCKVKRITVNPGGRLSYQYHYKRSEVWTVVAGYSYNNIR